MKEDSRRRILLNRSKHLKKGMFWTGRVLHVEGVSSFLLLLLQRTEQMYPDSMSVKAEGNGEEWRY